MKLDPITRWNKNIAEYALGHQPGRPTISRRTAGVLSDVTGIDEDLCVDLFHGFLVVAGAAGVGALVQAFTPKPQNPQGT